MSGTLGTTTIAGNGSSLYLDGALSAALLQAPMALACTPGGGVVLADAWRIRFLPYDEGTIGTLVGGNRSGAVDGTGTAALLGGFLRGLALRPSTGEVYVTDQSNARIRVLNLATRYLSTLVGAGGRSGFADGPAAFALLAAPYALAFDATETLWFTDMSNNALRTLTPAGAVVTVAGAPFAGQAGVAGWVDGAASSARFTFPKGLAIVPSSGGAAGGGGAPSVLIGDSNVVRRYSCPWCVCAFKGRSYHIKGFTRETLPP